MCLILNTIAALKHFKIESIEWWIYILMDNCLVNGAYDQLNWSPTLDDVCICRSHRFSPKRVSGTKSRHWQKLKFYNFLKFNVFGKLKEVLKIENLYSKKKRISETKLKKLCIRKRTVRIKFEESLRRHHRFYQLNQIDFRAVNKFDLIRSRVCFRLNWN
jgi:hypothetical protein